MFQVSNHDQEDMGNPEKLLYLRQTINGGPTAEVTEGLSHIGINVHIILSRITRAMTGTSTQTVTNCKVSPVYGNRQPLDVVAVVLPKVTGDMPTG